jgi:hypothetical protein
MELLKFQWLYRVQWEDGYEIWVGKEEVVPVLKENKGKGKAVPLQAWTGPEGSRRSRLPDF